MLMPKVDILSFSHNFFMTFTLFMPAKLIPSQSNSLLVTNGSQSELFFPVVLQLHLFFLLLKGAHQVRDSNGS